jgi:hypothetical protein
LIATLAAVAACGAAAASADASVPVVSVTGGNVVEGTGLPATATFTISSDLPAPGGGLSVPYTTANGTATAGQDFAAVGANPVTTTQISGIATIPEGESSTTVSVWILGDAIDEDDQAFTLKLTGPPSGGTLGTATGTMTILDDDAAPVISVADGYEGSDPANPLSEGTGPNRAMTFKVTLSAPSEKTIKVDYDTTPGTAQQQDIIVGVTGDYQRPGGTRQLTIPPNTAQPPSITVQIIADSIDEVDESFQVKLSTPQNVTLSPTRAIATGLILDDDGPTANVLDATVGEGAAGTTTSADVTVVLGATSVQDVSFVFTTADDTAKAPGDYDAVAAGQVLTIPAGRLTGTIRLTVRGDDLDEGNEQFRMNLGVKAGASVADGTAVITITDDDVPPALAVSSVAVPEGTGGASAAALTIALATPAGRTMKVGYATGDGSAAAGSDYQATSGTVTFGAGDTTQQISVPLVADATLEPDETFTVRAFHTSTDGAGQTVQDPVPATATGTVTIVDDDLAASNTPDVSVDSTRVREGDAGARAATFTLRLDAPSPRPVIVGYHTVDGTARSGSDYTATSGSVGFAPNTLTASVTVEVLGDRDVEPSEDFALALADPVNARIAPGGGSAIIIDDDAGGGPIGIGSLHGASVDQPTVVPLTALLCDPTRACAGVPVHWTVQRAGTIRIQALADVPVAAAGARTAAARARTKAVALLTRTLAVRSGAGSSRVRLTAGRNAAALLRRLRAARVRTGRIVVTFTNREGGQQTPVSLALVLRDDDAGGGPVTVGPARVRAASILCSSPPACGGVTLRWRTAMRGRMRVTVTGIVPARNGDKRSPAPVGLFAQTFTASRGGGHRRLVLQGTRAAELRAVLSARHVRRLRIAVTFSAPARAAQRTVLSVALR